ncbi:hypothetical protein [Dyadobacter fermentans]|nr:hypothetical protein [Dyadobacter fermentans]MBZ1363057.1 hypothetical protein [Dyadobacter fermentans]
MKSRYSRRNFLDTTALTLAVGPFMISDAFDIHLNRNELASAARNIR